MRRLFHRLRDAYYRLTVFRKLALSYLLTFVLPLALLASLSLYNMNRYLDNKYDLFVQDVRTAQRQNYQRKIEQLSSVRSLLTSNNAFTHYLQGWYLTTAQRVTMFNDDVVPLIRYVLSTNKLIRDLKIYPLKDIHIPPLYFLSEWDEASPPIDKLLDMSQRDLWQCRIEENGTTVITYCTCLYNPDYSQQLAVLMLDIDPAQMLAVVTGDENPVYYRYQDKLYWLTDDGSLKPTGQSSPPESTHENLLSFNSHGQYVYQDEMPELGISFFATFDHARFTNNDKLLLLCSLLVFCLLLTSIVFVTLAAGTKRIKRLSQHLSKEKNENLMPIAPGPYRDEIGNLYEAYNGLVENIHRLIDEVYWAELNERDARYYALLSQINAHFMMNTLENIRMTALMNGDIQASDMLFQLGSIMNYALRKDNLQSTLGSELEQIEYFLRLYAVRIGKDFSSQLDVPEKYRALTCPKFMLQPIVENAISHGFAGMQGEKRIRISAGEDRQGIWVDVWDNGIGMTETQLQQIQALLAGKFIDRSNRKQASIGLSNVNQRLQIFYHEPQGIFVRCDAEAKGTVFQLRLGRAKQISGRES